MKWLYCALLLSVLLLLRALYVFYRVLARTYWFPPDYAQEFKDRFWRFL